MATVAQVIPADLSARYEAFLRAGRWRSYADGDQTHDIYFPDEEASD